MRGQGLVYTAPAPVTVVTDAQTGSVVAMHKRATVTGTAAELGTFISGGIPSWWAGPTDTLKVKPMGVMLFVEAGSSGNVFITIDGTSTPVADGSLGILVPVAPGSLTMTGADVINGNIKAVASVNPTYVQCVFFP